MDPNNLELQDPIIEFEAGLKLYNFGTEAKTAVDLVDTVTTDVFSDIEGQVGYFVDGTELVTGMRVLFTADPDSLVNGKIYTVTFITQNGITPHLKKLQIPLTINPNCVGKSRCKF